MLRNNRSRVCYGRRYSGAIVSTNKQFGLAVHMLIMLAAVAPASLRSEAMAGSAVANPVSVRRVLGHFREAGLVASKSGAGGGTHLVRDATTISLADVWHVVYGEDHVLGLYEGDPGCPVGSGIQSLLLDVDARARRAVQQELATTTIAQLRDQALAVHPPAAPVRPPAAPTTAPRRAMSSPDDRTDLTDELTDTP